MSIHSHFFSSSSTFINILVACQFMSTLYTIPRALVCLLKERKFDFVLIEKRALRLLAEYYNEIKILTHQTKPKVVQPKVFKITRGI